MNIFYKFIYTYLFSLLLFASAGQAQDQNPQACNNNELIERVDVLIKKYEILSAEKKGVEKELLAEH